MNEYLGHTRLWHLLLQYPLVIYYVEFMVGEGARATGSEDECFLFNYRRAQDSVSASRTS